MKITMFGILLAIGAGLAACGGGHNNSVGSVQPVAANILDDEFIKQVSTVAGTTGDSLLPISIDAITASTPETNEAAALI